MFTLAGIALPARCLLASSLIALIVIVATTVLAQDQPPAASSAPPSPSVAGQGQGPVSEPVEAVPANPADETLPPPPTAPTVHSEEIERLVTVLEDPVLRDALVGQLRVLLALNEGEDGAVPTAPPIPTSLGAQVLAFLSARLDAADTALDRISGQATDWPVLTRWFTTQVTNERARARWISLFSNLALIIGTAIAVRWGVTQMLARARTSIGVKAGRSIWSRIPLLIARMILDALPLIAFVVVAYAIMGWVDTDRRGQLVAVALVNAATLTGVIMMMARTILTPQTPNLRLIPIDNAQAAYLYVWARRIAYTTVFGYFAVEVSRLLFVPFLAREALALVVGLTVFGQIIVFVLQNRRSVKQWLRSSTLSGPFGAMLRRVSDIWHIIALAYMSVAFAIWLLDVPGGFTFMVRATALTLVIVIASRLIGGALVQGVHRLFAIPEQLAAQYPGLGRRAGRYQGVIETLLQAAVWVVATVLLVDVWGGDILVFLMGEWGGRLVGSMISITLVTAISIGVWELVSNLIERRLTQTDSDGNPIEQNQRVRTLLPLLRNVILVVLITIVALIVLSELGLNIAPLLAGAGVIGLAVGFGSQTLVQDVITGLFILFEDTISVGDVVDVGGHAGIVEAMSIRTLRLRDLSGNVHTVPFSQVSTVRNMTKEFSFAVFDVGVAYREDTDHVTQVLHEIGRDLRADPDYGAVIVDNLEVLGVDAFADSAVVIKARIKTKPIKQWMVAREFNRRMKKRFDAEGIEIPFPHQTLYFGADRTGKAPSAQVTLASPDVSDALSRLSQRRRGGDANSADNGRTTPATKTPDQISDEAQRSTPGHDMEEEGNW